MHSVEARTAQPRLVLILSTGRAALNRAWKQGEILAAPHIKSLREGAAEPLGRAMALEEVRAFYHLCDADHLRAFILWSLGTTARPDAILDLQRAQIDDDHGLVHLNPPGRTQTKKHRPTVRLPDTLRDFLPGPGEFVVTFRSKPLQSIRSAWRTHRVRWGFDDRVNPYSLRHTMGRWLRRQSVPPWEVAAQFGHKRADVSITDIYAPVDPHSLDNAVRAIDAFLTELPASPQARA